MTESLEPNKIYNNYIDGNISKEVASDLLITLIENSDFHMNRIEGLEILEKIGLRSEKIFKTFGFDETTIFDLNNELKVYQFFLLQWIEVENRAMVFLDKYNKHNDCYTLETPKDLNDAAILKDMFEFFKLKLKQEDIVFRGRRNRNIRPTVITEDEKDKLKEIVSNIDDQYLKIFRNKPYTNFDWIKILS